MSPEKEDYLRKWLIKANEDIDVINYLSKEHPEQYTSALCFHSQQAVEKFLKAFLIYYDAEFKKVHDVDYLLTLCTDIDQTKFRDIDLKSLNDYGVSVRYPDDFLLPALAESLYYKDAALEIKHIVEDSIKFE